MLEEYFAAADNIVAANAWIHVYKLLLWIDRTTGLAHCYESDKSQPGRPWYARSLSFHGWISKRIGCTPTTLGSEVDWLFRRASTRLAGSLARLEAQRTLLADEQRRLLEAEDFPKPGEDPGLEELLREELGPWVSEMPSQDVLARLGRRIYAYISQENKRKNLLGEGFEDVLASVIQRIPGASELNVRARPPLHSVPGFRPPPTGEKPRKVDLALLVAGSRRILVSSKWSIRADREEQFVADFDSYARLEDAGRDFDFVLITNEFDAARLSAACEKRRQNALLFSSVVHVNPEGPLVAYGDSGRGAAKRLTEHVRAGRLVSLEAWLEELIR